MSTPSVITTLVLLGVTAWLVQRAWRWADRPGAVEGWAQRRGLELDGAGTAHLRRYLAVTRRGRTLGWAIALTPVIIAGLLREALPVSSPLLDPAMAIADAPVWELALTGYVLGLLGGELVMAREAATTDGTRTARLQVRDTTTYTTRRESRLRAAAMAALLLSLLWTGAAVPTWLADWRQVGSPVAVLWRAVLAIAAVVVLEVVRRWVSRRPQRGPGGSVTEADDVGRASVLSALLSVQIAALLLAASNAAVWAGLTLGGAIWTPVGLVTSIVLALLAIAALSTFGPHHEWRPRQRPSAEQRHTAA